MNDSPVSLEFVPKKKKPTFTSALATWASELFSIYALSSETCLARAVVGATRSVACAHTTHHLATSKHRNVEYDQSTQLSNRDVAKDFIAPI